MDATHASRPDASLGGPVTRAGSPPLRSRLLPRGVRAMLLLLILTILVPLLLVQAGIYFSWFQSRRQTELNANLELARAVASNFDAYVRDVLNQEFAIGLATASPEHDEPSLIRLLEESRKQYPAVRYYSWVSPQGKVIVSSSRKMSGLDVAARPFFQEILAGRDWIVSDLMLGRVDDQPTFAIARAVRDGDEGLRGVVMAYIDPSRLDSSLGVRRGGAASISLVDGQGWLVYRFPEMPASFEARNWVAHDGTYRSALAGEEIATVVRIPGEPERLAGRVPIESIGWAAGASRPVDEAMAPILFDLTGYGVLSLLVSLGAVALAAVLSRRLTRPLDRLRGHALAVGRGEFGRRKPPEGPLEVAELTEAFNRMAEEVRSREETQRKRAAEVALLADVSDLLAASLDYETTLTTVANLAVPRVADWCVVDVAEEGGTPRQVIAVHADPAMGEAVSEIRRLPPQLDDPANPVARVFRSGRAELLADAPECLSSSPDGRDEPEAAIRPLKALSSMIVPMVVRGRTLGTILFASGPSGRRYDNEDLALVELLARRAALAIDNARLYREAQEAVRARDEFLSVAAHELKTPLTSLRGFAQLTMRGWEKTGKADEGRLKQAFEVIDQQSRKLSLLVSQLLDISRMQEGRLILNEADTDIVPIVENVLSAARAGAESHQVTYQGPAALVARVDALRLEQVITNLVGNAVKFSPEGGEVQVSVDSPNEEEIRIAVRDHGIGIPLERRARIFDRFYQAHTEGYYGGMGLGLYISREIVILHGGEIHAEFPEDGGTRFVVTLPR